VAILSVPAPVIGPPVNPGSFGNLYPICVRGEAYLAARRGVEAVAEFRRILEHRGIVVSDPIGALASVQLARAYFMRVIGRTPNLHTMIFSNSGGMLIRKSRF
jgi:hypothetical protein